jgi:hyperosmotically inducible periplasmic protein
VRKAVVDNDVLSTNAHNVKIITQNGIVTLRGPVNTATEKATVVALARSTPGVTRVDDQLEVKATD